MHEPTTFSEPVWHAQQAERLLRDAAEASYHANIAPQWIAAAQVHATLAGLPSRYAAEGPWEPDGPTFTPAEPVGEPDVTGWSVVDATLAAVRTELASVGATDPAEPVVLRADLPAYDWLPDANGLSFDFGDGVQIDVAATATAEVLRRNALALLAIVADLDAIRAEVAANAAADAALTVAGEQVLVGSAA